MRRRTALQHGHANGNRLLSALSAEDFALIEPDLEAAEFAAGDVLFEAGEEVIRICFPDRRMVAALILSLRDGASAEAAMIGREGAAGGVVSEGEKPAYARGVVQMGGAAFLMSTEALNAAKGRSPTLGDHFARYADCLLAQVLQSVACNAIHNLDARLARWLLTLQDRLGRPDLDLTQEFIAQMLGVHRSYATRVLGELEARGAVRRSRGRLAIVDRPRLEAQACDCYAYLRRHFERVLPGVYPSFDAVP